MKQVESNQSSENLKFLSWNSYISDFSTMSSRFLNATELTGIDNLSNSRTSTPFVPRPRRRLTNRGICSPMVLRVNFKFSTIKNLQISMTSYFIFRPIRIQRNLFLSLIWMLNQWRRNVNDKMKPSLLMTRTNKVPSWLCAKFLRSKLSEKNGAKSFKTMILSDPGLNLVVDWTPVEVVWSIPEFVD